MMYLRTCTALLVLLGIFLFLFVTPVFAASPDELKQQIEARLRELESINAEIERNQRELEETQQQKTSLNKELKSLGYSINQVDLGIRSSEIMLQKLNLEIDSLEYTIADTEREVAVKKEAVVRLLREMQQKDSESLLVALLRGQSLAESVLEANAIIELNTQLSVEARHLQDLHARLSEQFARQTKKRIQTEIESHNLKSKKVILDDKKDERATLLTRTKNQEQLYQEQLEKLREQQNAISDAISEIEDELRRSFDPSILPATRPGVLAWPVTLKSDGGIGRITQHYGEHSYLYRGKPHNGLDIGAPVGTPVYAADDGLIKAVDDNDRSSWQKYQYGKYVLIEHDTNLATLYAHLSNNSVVQPGERVRRGQLIGYVGSTGYSTGPHLHFGVYWAPSVLMKSIPPARGLVPVGVIIDPEGYL